MESATKVLPEIEQDLSEPDEFAHYARKDALVQGGVVLALCGKKWKPYTTGPEVLDKKLCPSCAEYMSILEMIV